MSAKSGDAELPRLLFVVGPTASGKTSLAVRIAEQCDGEVVSADSVQVYRYFDIGSGKASAAERRGIAHHLIDVIEPGEEMDASLFAQAALEAIADVRGRGKVPIICGGTFLWIKALLFGLAKAPPKDDAIRARHQAWAEQAGRSALHVELGRVDPPSAARLNPNDLVRVSRALEVFELTGTPLSVFQERHAFSTPRFDAHFVGIAHERQALAERIVSRVRAMFSAGWIDEVSDLLERGFGDTRPMQSVGYLQLKRALLSGQPLDVEALTEEIAQVTRVFSRRQRTWLRDQPVRWLSPEEAERAQDLATS